MLGVTEKPLLIKQLLSVEHAFEGRGGLARGERLSPPDLRHPRHAGRQPAQPLQAIGVRPGDRVGTLAWNTYWLYEAYFGVPCMGAVLHTLNLRLSPEQISSMSNQVGRQGVVGRHGSDSACRAAHLAPRDFET